jgi:magnesium transporter
MLRMAGTVEEHPYHESIFAGALKRLPFLFVTLTGGVMVAELPKLFGTKIEGRILLTVTAALPLVCALAGNVAIVTATVMVRGLATGEINQQRTLKAIARETMIGFLLGIVLAAVAGFVLSLRADGPGEPGGSALDPSTLFTAVASGLTLGIIWASFVGALVPLGCRLTGKIDPAIASGPFVTMLCDLSASFIFLSIVVYLLGKS